MLFWRYFRGSPTDWVSRIHQGKTRAQGLGLSFYYLPGFSNIVSVPTAAVTTDFHFEERSSDYQIVHVQGVLTWRVTEPQKAVQLLNYTVDSQNRFLSEDPKKLEEKLQYLAAVSGRRALQTQRLEQALRAADVLGGAIQHDLAAENYLSSAGVTVLSVEVLSLRPDPEVGRALEAATRESLLKQSDDATAQRRLSALENERVINEREAGNELAKDRAARMVAETRENHAKLEQQHEIALAARKLEAELEQRRRQAEGVQAERLSDARNDAERDRIRMESSLALAEREKELAVARLEVARRDAEAEKARLDVVYESLRSLSAEQLQAMALMGARPGTTIAHAFQRLAERAGHIGQLNISPDLLQSLLDHGGEPGGAAAKAGAGQPRTSGTR